MNEKEIFISYSWKDMRIVGRVYSDLIRSGLLLWRDDYSACFGKTYQKEINQAMENCKGLVLFDSPNSRYSKYVQDECKILKADVDWKNGEKQIAICLVGNPVSTHSAPELFEGQNLIKYFDFSTSNLTNLYDNDRSYYLGITELCRFWKVEYKSLYPVCTQKDFEDELSKFDLKNIDRDILLKEFDLIELRLVQKFPGTLKRLRLFLDECEYLNIKCPTPMLQLGVELAKASLNSKAKLLLTEYTNIYSDDPRGWKVLASVLFDMKEYQEALLAYNKTISLITNIEDAQGVVNKYNNPFNSEKHLSFLLLSKLNRASTHFQLKQFPLAINEYQQLLNDPKYFNQLLPEHFLVLNGAFDSLNMKEKQADCLKKALSKYSGDYGLNLAMARLLFVTDNINEAIRYFEYLVNREIFDLEVCAEYLSILKIAGLNKKFDLVINLIYEFIPSSEKELYYFGYILFLNGDEKKAKQYYQKSNYTALPWYEEIWKN